MEYTTLGRTGVQVSRLCLGTLAFGKVGNPEHADCERIISRAIDSGINIIDTADVYNAGESEEIVGKALLGRRDDVVLASKARMPISVDRNERGSSRRWLRQACENSLRRLQTDHLDLYQLHRPDPRTDIDETLGVMSDLIHEGKILYAGHSMFSGSQIIEAQWVADRRNRERFVTEQPPYSILVREIEYDVLPACKRNGMGVLSWGPLHGGWLSGKVHKGSKELNGTRSHGQPHIFDTSIEFNQRKLDAVDQLTDLAQEAGLSLIHISIAFVLRHPAITSAIIGPRTMEHFESQVGAIEVRLSDDILNRIDEIVPAGRSFHYLDHGPLPPSLGSLAERRRP